MFPVRGKKKPSDLLLEISSMVSISWRGLASFAEMESFG